MDRFDCQYLMATFVNVYIASFIRYGFVLLDSSTERFQLMSNPCILQTVLSNTTSHCHKELKIDV